MSLLKAPEVLESAVQVTQERDEALLRRSLIRTICELLPAATHAAILRRDVVTGTYMARAASSEALRPLLQTKIREHESLLREAALSAQPRMQQTADGLIYIQPVDAKGEGAELLVARLETTDVEDHRILSAFGRLYANFIQLVHESERDRLTGLYNRRSFDSRLSSVIDGLRQPGSRAPGQGRWLALFDVDHFKRINDGYGHLYGDEVLLLLARIVQQCFRDEDFSFRYGGEEFAVVLSRCAPQHAHAAMERLREQVEKYSFPQVGRVTISIGYTELEAQLAPADVIGRADRALYAAKTAGRNQVISYAELARTLPPAEAPRVGAIELF